MDRSLAGAAGLASGPRLASGRTLGPRDKPEDDRLRVRDARAPSTAMTNWVGSASPDLSPSPSPALCWAHRCLDGAGTDPHGPGGRRPAPGRMADGGREIREARARPLRRWLPATAVIGQAPYGKRTPRVRRSFSGASLAGPPRARRVKKRRARAPMRLPQTLHECSVSAPALPSPSCLARTSAARTTAHDRRQKG
jgi:hypothetical protein